MKIISHRGNIQGPVPDKENRPSYIDCALQLGYEVEVDLRFEKGEFWLGHDEAQYKIEKHWASLRKEHIWFHCKDIYSCLELAKLEENFKYFCHEFDNYVITSTGKIWVHDLTKIIDNNCIIPLISLNDIKQYKNSAPYGVCTDYVNELKLINFF
jgi:hypothetical protein